MYTWFLARKSHAMDHLKSELAKEEEYNVQIASPLFANEEMSYEDFQNTDPKSN